MSAALLFQVFEMSAQFSRISHVQFLFWFLMYVPLFANSFVPWMAIDDMKKSR